MEFGSIAFLFRFLPIFILLYFLAPGKTKNGILLMGSLCFYAWGKPSYVLLIAGVTVLDYLLGQGIEIFRGRTAAKVFLAISVLVNVGIVLLTVYGSFLLQTVNSLVGTQFMLPEMKQPFGIMVYTLQTLSYTIDVYRGKVKAQKNLLDYGVYVSLFPQLLVGPVVRYADLEEQLHHRETDISQIASGAKRACIGLAKKVLLADAAGELWKAVTVIGYENLSAATAWLGILAFAFRMYFYFSGYSDMAIGLAACLGFTFPENYQYPYTARSITEFCKRWNIGLGNWMKEYIYIPLGGSRKGMLRQFISVAVVWGLTGMWYGADWTFLLWGLWMAGFLMLEKLFLRKVLEVMPGVLNWFYTTAIAALGWVFFAVANLAEAKEYLFSLFGQGTAGLWDMRFIYLSREYLPIILVGILASTPIFSAAAESLKNRKTGFCIALYRLGEKVIPPALFLLSLIWIIGRIGA